MRLLEHDAYTEELLQWTPRNKKEREGIVDCTKRKGNDGGREEGGWGRATEPGASALGVEEKGVVPTLGWLGTYPRLSSLTHQRPHLSERSAGRSGGLWGLARWRLDWAGRAAVAEKRDETRQDSDRTKENLALSPTSNGGGLGNLSAARTLA